MTKSLVIVFVKNIRLGHVKTRLASSIGHQGAYDVYAELLNITENAVSALTSDSRVYFSENIESSGWSHSQKYLQQGLDLGERMLNAFTDGFKDGYETIILIGSDLPDISTDKINRAIGVLTTHDLVIGPAKDGGYYLIGMSSLITQIFHDKPWSQPLLLQETLNELSDLSLTFELLEELNDIDTYEDLISSDLYKLNMDFQEKIKQLYDQIY